MGCLKLLLCTFVLYGIFPFITGDSRGYLKHRDSEKYIGKWNGVNAQRVPLVKSPKDAQLITAVLNNTKGVLLTVRQGNRTVAYIDKYGGCASPLNEVVYYVLRTGDNQLWTINNDGTVGNICCRRCLLRPTPDLSRVILEDYNCRLECNDNFVFIALFENELPKA